jgi:hypothetical protein
MTTTGSIPLLARTLAQTDAIVARVRPEQATLPTPCGAWDVRALVNHVVHDVQQFTVRENLKPQFRGDEANGRSFGAEVAVADGAPLYDRLVGFFGRDPS